MLIVDKPAGMVVHPSAGHDRGNILCFDDGLITGTWSGFEHQVLTVVHAAYIVVSWPVGGLKILVKEGEDRIAGPAVGRGVPGRRDCQ